MKILITGGAGFIGSNLVRLLVASDKPNVVLLDDLSAGQPEPEFAGNVELVRGDFTDSTLLGRCMKGVDVVVHLAALTGVIDSISNPQKCFQLNAFGSFQLLEIARKLGIKKVICASTGGALFGDVPPPISEAPMPTPLSPYGASKLAMEGFCSAYSGSFGLACTALRFSNVYGPGSTHKSSVVAAFIKNILAGTALTIYGDGSQQRDYLYVGDVVGGIKSIIDQDVPGVFQLGSGKPTSLLQLIDALETVVGHKLDIRFEPARRGEVRSTWCDISKAQQTFSFKADTPLIEGLRATFDFFIGQKATIKNANNGVATA